MFRHLALLSLTLAAAHAQLPELSGVVTDPQGRAVAGARVHLGATGLAMTDAEGRYAFRGVRPGKYPISAEAEGFATVTRQIDYPAVESSANLRFTAISARNQSLVITSKVLEPGVDLRNAETFNKTLFTRDDQALQLLNAGINAGQHEGGGKSLEIRRFGFNMDHGGVNGGLKILLDGVQQNQGTQGHGQGYLGSMKAMTPELIEQVTIVNGPFSPEYGDFSGLGVVHIRQRESLPDQFTTRLQGGNYDTGRAFFGYSPTATKSDSYLAWEGSYTNGPFQNPGRYRRDNINANYTRILSENKKAGVRFIFGRNNFFSSGQLPLDLVAAGQLDRFGSLDDTGGGRVRQGTVSGYYSQVRANGDTIRADGFVGRSLFDLYSDFTVYLNDPVAGDAFQQHDSRLQEGANAQYIHPHRLFGLQANFTGGGNFHDNQINVGLYPREGRVPTGVSTRANAHVTNGAGYAQESVSLLQGRLVMGAGLRFDEFRYGLVDRAGTTATGAQSAGRWQGKANAAFTPSRRLPLTLHANYGRGINSVDARGVVQRPASPRLATTDFYQVGTSSSFSRLSVATDLFLIDHSNEQVYVPDDGSFELKGPSRAYGFEVKTSLEITHHLSLNGGVTKVANAFYKGGATRVYVDSAPHFVANAALTLAPWHKFSGSLRMRAINHYRLDGEDPSIVASGHTVVDLGVSRQINRRLDLNLAVDNLTSRDYYETQNFFESRVSPGAPVLARIHGTPGYPVTVVAGVTMRFGGK
ncbi:MAG: TonB-dependent receptor [Bryobacterales bacterium]|nr:TonB-dependent receptor [Bryobacterales bacterium]